MTDPARATPEQTEQVAEERGVWFVFFCDHPEHPFPMEVGFTRDEYEHEQCDACGRPLRVVAMTPKSRALLAEQEAERLREAAQWCLGETNLELIGVRLQEALSHNPDKEEET